MRPYRSVDTDVLRNLIEDSGLSFSQNSVSWIFTCPRCGKGKKLYVSKRSGRFVCFRCKETDNFQGRPEYALAELLGESVANISRQLYGDADFDVELFIDVELHDFFGEDDPIDEDAIEHDVGHWPYDFYEIDEAQSKRGLDYVESRGISVGMAKRYDIRYSPELRRIYFPVGANGLLYGWQGRLVVPHEMEVDGEPYEAPKILSSRGMRRERLLMFADRLKGCEHAVLCEGPIDAIKAHFCKGNIATMGKAVSPQQIQLLRHSGVKRLYLALDPDAAEEMNRLVDDLKCEIQLFNMVPKGMGKVDLGAMSFVDVYNLFLNATLIENHHVFVFFNPNVR
jgi:hypothetical protein